jgi:hypothetical protein
MFKQRSSWPSSFVTGLIGWNGFLIIAALAFGAAASPVALFAAGTAAAVVQVLLLRLAFFALRLDKGLAYGAIWGAVTAAAIIVAERALIPALTPRFAIWFFMAVYVGPAVGAFLSYFHRDDRAIEAEAAPGGPVDYGRDAHWLEPFGFGAAAYLLAFAPRSADIALSAAVVGAMSGVFAAGASHFVLFSKLRKSAAPFVVGLIGGAAQGAVTGLLFRRFAADLWLPPVAVGAIAGVLTYAMTIMRGHHLARREADEETPAAEGASS